MVHATQEEEEGEDPTSPSFDALTQREPDEFLDKTFLAKTRRIGLLYGGKCIILTSNGFD